VHFGAAIEDVGELVGAFDLIADFHPQIAGCDADGDGVGAKRTIWLSDGQEVEDRLSEVLGHGYAYEGVDSQNMRSWRGRIEIVPDGDGTNVSWTVDYEPKDGVDVDALDAQLRGVLEEGLASARRLLAGS